MKGMSLVASAASLALARHHPNLIRRVPTLSTNLQYRQVPHKCNTYPTCSNFFRYLSSGVDPKSVPVGVAHQLLQSGHRYLDVRTPEEFSEGHALGAVNIPYMFKSGNGMEKNPKFLEEVSKHFGKDAEIVVGYRSGKRSFMAAADLSTAGFGGVYDIAGGYIAWIQSGLPTELLCGQSAS